MINTLPTPQDNCLQTQRRSQRHRCPPDRFAYLCTHSKTFKRGNSVKEQWYWPLSHSNLWTIVHFVKLSCTSVCNIIIIVTTVNCLFLHAITIKRLVFLNMCGSDAHACAIIANIHQNLNIRFLASYICATPHLIIKFCCDFPTLWLSWIMAIK